MSYLDFLSRWYNLAFLAVGLAGLVVASVGRLRGDDRFTEAVSLLATAVVGLTWNGAIHDLGRGSPAPRFPLVLVVSAVCGLLVGRAARRLRERYFRPIRGVRFNLPGHEGTVAHVVTKAAGPEPGSGRAQWLDAEGVLHVVHVHTEGPLLPFGERVRLVRFDPQTESYLVSSLRREADPPDRKL